MRRDDPDGFAYESFEGHKSLVTLNHSHDAVLDMICDVAEYWLARGADGFRLDAAYAVPVDFWRSFMDRVRVGHPEAFFVGEVIHGDYPRLVEQTGIDSVTQYELWKAIWSSINDRNFFELAWALSRHHQFCTSFPPLTFTGNHDVTRIASRLDDARHLAHALVVLMTVPGVPSIYYGDERGWRGVKFEREGGDDEIRSPFPNQPHELAEGGQQTHRIYRELIKFRREHAWLATGYQETLHLTNQQIVIQVVGLNDERVLTSLNVGDQPSSARIPWDRDVLPTLAVGREVETWLDDGELHVTGLAAHDWSILEIGPR